VPTPASCNAAPIASAGDGNRPSNMRPAERVRRLEAPRIIRGFTVDVDTRAIGYQIRVIVRRPLPGKLHIVERLIQERPEFVECDKITGDDRFLARLVVHSIEQMDDVFERSLGTCHHQYGRHQGNICQTAAPPL
jgi:DNA-binding Lrp family transcriptional regulator